MSRLSASEHTALDTIDAPAMLAQVETWAAINSGSRNIDGLGTMAAQLQALYQA